MSNNNWLFILLFIVLIVLPLLPEIIGWLLMIGSNRSPQHKRRAHKRVAIWIAICISVATFIFLKMHFTWNPTTIICTILLISVLSFVVLRELFLAFKSEKNNNNKT